MKRVIRIGKLAPLPIFLALLMIGPSIFADGGANHRTRNLHFGVSGGNVNDASRRFCCSGTLGALLQGSGGAQYVLSNNHVLGRSGQASAGEDISQPGLIDSNCQVSTVIADFTVAPGLNQNVDAAIAQVRSGMMDATGFIEDIGTISSVVRTPTVGLSVAKSGRTTGFTTGSVTSVTTTVSVRYPKSCGGGGGATFTFTGQVVVTPGSFSAGGDSGSLIVSNDNCHQPVALLFAGSSSATIGNPAGQVLTRVGAALGQTVSFVGDNCSASSLASDSSAGQDEIGLSSTAVEYAATVKKGRETELMSRAGVIGVGVGAADDNPAEAVIVIYVDKTAPIKARLPKRMGGLKVKKVFTDPFVAL
jgi:hypothetical protein